MEKKGILKSIVLSSLLFVITVFSGYAQQNYYNNPKYGKDSASRMECLKNLSLYREYMKQDNIKDATSGWKKVYNICPKASKNIYIDGEKILSYYINNAKDDATKNKLIDSLMSVYDKRIKHYNQEGFVLGKKGVDYLQYKRGKVEDVKKAYDMLEQSIKMRGTESGAAVLVTYMSATESLFKSDEISGDKVLKNYQRVMDIVNQDLSTNPNDKRAQAVKKNVNMIFERSGAATCKSLIKLYKPQFEENPEDIELLKKMIGLLDDTGCKDSDLYFNAAAQLHKLEPSASSAYELANLAHKRGEIEKAKEYFNEAINLTEEKNTKSKYYLEMSQMVYRETKELPEARDYAKKAIDTNPENGDAYMMLGNIYASVKGFGDNEVQEKSVFWLAVDYYQKAKKVDPALAEEANSQIQTYKQYFPAKENIFFYGYNEGDNFKLGGWINETTTVRIP